MKRFSKIEKVILLICMTLIAGLVIFPFLWMVLTSFKTEAEAIATPPTLFSASMSLANYAELFQKMDFLLYTRNTLIVVAFAFIGLFINAFCGYGFAKYNFPHKEKLFLIVLGTMMIPAQVTMIPVYLLINRMGLVNTFLGIALPGLAGGFSIFLFRQFMSAIPTEIIEAARIDGLGEIAIFFKIVMPMAKPIFSIQAILTFIGGWNAFLWPLIIATDAKHYTLSIGLQLLQGQHTNKYALQMAGSTLMVIPILIIFFIFQKNIIDGSTTSGLKG